ncbi:hypothetical protein BGZ91_008472 [Linnemannia elongata]|nr:hypothetical protein BGZ91_008472 [Linnemannia elongata]
MEWFCMAADQGNAEAQYNVGAMYNYGEGVKQDFAKAVEWFRMAADQGDVDAQYYIGVMYTNGQGVTKNDSEARKWFQMAADQGPTGSIPKAQHNSSKTSVDQPSSEDNEPRLLKEISPLTNKVSALADISLPTKPVVSQSDIDAQVTLGYNYMDSQDYQAAIKCYLKAANQGHPVGQRCFGAMHHSSESVAQNYSIAIWWYLKSVDQGDAEAYLNIRTVYKHGHGVPQDFSRAMNWYQDAANHGLAEGQYRLGCMYRYGQSTAKDDSQVVHWFLKATSNGHLLAKLHLKELEWEEKQCART